MGDDSHGEPAPREDAAGSGVPLVVDVDGTLLRGDLAWESLWAALAASPLRGLLTVLRHRRDPAALKAALVDLAAPDVTRLALNPEVMALIDKAREEGRPVVLSSGSDRRLVDALAARLGLPGRHDGTDGAVNLVGATKAAALCERFGRNGFDYAGNEARDLPVWAAARRGYAIAPGRGLARRIAGLATPVEVIGRRQPLWPALWRGMRPYQWLKNLALFLPLLAAHRLGWAEVLPVLAMVAAFCAAASAIYLINDLFDLGPDRQHPEKRHRPIASGALPIPAAMGAAAVLAALAVAVSAAVGPATLVLVVIYLALSVTYSAWAKRRRWIDMAALVGLYGLRIGSGAAAAGVAMSPWLWAFIGAVLLALTAVKRLTALSRRETSARLPGRGYGTGHRPAVIAVALVASFAAVAFWLAYATGADAAALYRRPWLLLAATVPVAGWLLRMISLSAAGREDYDPVRFVEHDRTGFLIALAGLAMVIAAT